MMESSRIEPIHLSDFASQPDVQIKCTGAWGTPAWGESAVKADDENGEGGVYRLQDGTLYTFTDSAVTCDDCRKRRGGR